MATLHLLLPLDPLLLLQCGAAMAGLLLHLRAPVLPEDVQAAIIAATGH